MRMKRGWQQLGNHSALDYSNAGKLLGLEYVSNDGTGQRPVMLRIEPFLASVERFFGILIEHCAGKFLVWA